MAYTNETILPAKFHLANIYEYSVANPREYNYIAIGSSPRITILDKFTPKIDQLLPQFLINDITNPSKRDRTFRIVHIDAATEKDLPFLHEYFNLKSKMMGINFVYDDSEEMHIWRSDDFRIEIIFLFVNIYHGMDIQYQTVNNRVDDTWFLEKMVETTLKNKNKLIIQEFSGHPLEKTRKIIYANYKQNIDQRQLFLNNILMHDECHCGQAIDTYIPHVRPDGSFYQFLIYSNDEMKALIGTDDSINEILKNHFVRNFKMNLSNHHINYTRKITGANLMYHVDEYNETTTADEIMNILIKCLSSDLECLDKLGFLTDSIKENITELFTNYKNYDLHKWRIAVGKIF
jgi:hypothetical protein